MRFKHFLGVLGFAVMAAGYSLPGAYERILYYYSYKLDRMTGGENIASGCSKSGVCSFDEFVHYIEGNKPGKVVAITPEEFPPIEKTAQKLQMLGKTSTVSLGRVIDKAESYPDLLKKLGAKLEGPLSKSSGFQHPKLKGDDLVKKVENIKRVVLESFEDVFDARLRATFNSFKPYEKFQVVIADGGKAIDIAATVEKNKGSITTAKLEALWTEHVKGRVVTEAIVKQFKPLADYSPPVQEVEAASVVTATKTLQRAKADLTLQEALKKNPWMSKKWLQGKYVETIAGNHKENLRELNGAIKTIRTLVCDVAKRDVGIMGKRKLGGCGPWELADLGQWLEQNGKRPGAGTAPEAPEAPGASARKAKMAKIANQASTHEFDVSVADSKVKIPGSWRKNGVAAFDDVRTKLLNRKLFAPKSLKLPAYKSFGQAAKGLGRAAWAAGVVHSFVTNTTELDKLAAATSIVPFAGCVTNAANLVHKGYETAYVAVDAVLCAIADALLLSGALAPVGMVLHLARLVMSFFVAPPGPTLDELQKRSRVAWSEFLELVYASIYSSSWHTSTHFGSKLESALAMNHIAALSEAADSVGLLNASSWATIDTFKSQVDFNQEQLELESAEAIAAIRAGRSTMVARRQREYLFGVLNGFDNGTAFSLQETANQYSAELAKIVNSEDFMNYYPEGKPLFNIKEWTKSPTTHPTAFAIKSSNMIHKHLRMQMKNGHKLRFPPPQVPPVLHFAFVLGQSKGLKDIHPETLSTFSYFDAEISEASLEPIRPAYRYSLVLRQTLEMAQRIQGVSPRNHVHKLFFPLEDTTLLNRMHLIIAMKLGSIYERARFWRGDEPFQSPSLYNVEPIMAYPFVPPVTRYPEDSLLIGLILGVVDTLNDEVLGSKVQDALLDESAQLKLKNWEAVQTGSKNIQTAAEKFVKKRAGPPRPPQEFIQAFSGICGQHIPENCAAVTNGCYYPHNTTKEFVETCMHETLQQMTDRTSTTWLSIWYRKREVCKQFDSSSDCAVAYHGCQEVYPLSTLHVIHECASRWLRRLRQDDPKPVAAATSPNTTEVVEKREH